MQILLVTSVYFSILQNIRKLAIKIKNHDHMKKLTISLLILFAFVNSFAQSKSYQSKQFALISFNYQISKDLKPQFDQFQHLFPDTENKKADKVIGPAKDITWYLLKDKLEKETGMYILPINAQGNKFRYDAYNFPDIKINRALKKGTSRYYIKVDLTVSSNTSQKDTGRGTTGTNEDSVQNSENLCTPSITILLTLYNDKGILPIKRESGMAVATEGWEMSEEIFTGIANRDEYDPESTNTLLGLTNAAIRKLLNRL